MWKFLAVVAACFAFSIVALPSQAQAQQIVVPPCPSDADCHFSGGMSERESIRSWNNGGGGQYPPQTGGPYYGGGGGRGGVSVYGTPTVNICLFGCNTQAGQGGRGGYQNQGGGGQGGQMVVDPQAAANCQARGGVIRPHANGFTCIVNPNRR